MRIPSARAVQLNRAYQLRRTLERVETIENQQPQSTQVFIDPARVTPTSQYHVTGVQPAGIEF